jgi:hypothetical protein
MFGYFILPSNHMIFINRYKEQLEMYKILVAPEFLDYDTNDGVMWGIKMRGSRPHLVNQPYWTSFLPLLLRIHTPQGM